MLETKAMVYLAQGDLDRRAADGARGATAEVDPTALVAVLRQLLRPLLGAATPSSSELLLRLDPERVRRRPRHLGHRAGADSTQLRGDRRRARAYADSARLAFEERSAARPDDAQRHVFLGLALAYLGRKAEAIREGERGVALLPISQDGYSGPYIQHQLVRIYILVGEPEKALDQLEPLLRIPYYLSPGWLRIDPDFDPLRSNPRFQKLVEGTA